MVEPPKRVFVIKPVGQSGHDTLRFHSLHFSVLFGGRARAVFDRLPFLCATAGSALASFKRKIPAIASALI